MNEFNLSVLNELAKKHSQMSWGGLQHYAPYNEIADVLEEVVELSRLLLIEKVVKMKIDILGNCAYSGGSFPKKWLSEEVPKMQARNNALNELLEAMKKESEEIKKKRVKKK